MKGRVNIQHDQYSQIQYAQFNQSACLRVLMKIAGLISLPFVYPLVIISRLSPETGFLTISEMLSLVPFAVGIIIRYKFYRHTLRSCGDNVFISFGTIFNYPEVSLGNNVLIGMYNTIHHCDFGNHVLTAEGCRFLSGSTYHDYSRTDIPMTKQGGKLKRIRIGDDVWIGANCVVMDDVGSGSVIGAGSVVTKKIEPFSVAVGNPAKVLKKRL